jgi:hypothetical protein
MALNFGTFGTSRLYGTGNFLHQSNAEGSTYLDFAYTLPLSFTPSFEHPVPTDEGIYQPTVGHSYPNVLFTGFADGFWVHRVFLEGRLVKTFTLVDQQFAIPIQFDFVESVCLQTSIELDGDDIDGKCPDVPGPASIVTLCAGLALIMGKRSRRF